MAVKKCNCKNCGLCKQIYWLNNKMVNCEEYGKMAAPKHCDKFVSLEDYKIQQQIKEDYEYQRKVLECILEVVNKGGK